MNMHKLTSLIFVVNNYREMMSTISPHIGSLYEDTPIYVRRCMFDGICIRASVVCGYLFNTTIMFKSVRGDWLCDVYLATIKQRLQDNLKQGFDGEMKNSVINIWLIIFVYNII